MARIAIPFSGITTKQNHKDGECRTLVNLRPKNGIKKPVAPRKIIQELSQEYDLIFIHRGSGFENWIGVVHTPQDSVIYKDIKKTPVLISATGSRITSIQQTGNVLSFISDSNVYYALLKDNEYIFLGELPELPVLSFTGGNSDSVRATPYNVTGTKIGDMTDENFPQLMETGVNKLTDLFVNGGKDFSGHEYEAKGQALFDAHLLRYAFRLYDDSLTEYSPPVLLMPLVSIFELKRLEPTKSESGPYMDSIKVNGYWFIAYHDAEMIPVKWRDIIKSVDIFLSPAIGVSNIKNVIKKKPSPDPQTGYYNCNLIENITEECLETLRTTGNFYFLHSILASDNTEYFDFRLDTKARKRLKNLVDQESMPIGELPHRRGAECSYMYNSQLHLANLTTTIFKGFHPDYFAFESSYNGTYSMLDIEGEGEPISLSGIKKLISEVTINLNGKSEKLVSEYNNPRKLNGTYPYNRHISSFLSYPDPRATHMSLYIIDEKNRTYKLCSVKLEPHESLNISYYLNNKLTAIGERYNYEDITIRGESVKIREPNKLTVSEANNPFHFPNTQNFIVGDGTIKAIETIAKRISEGSFGQYPLYIFTSGGIYSLKLNEEGTYSNLSAPVSNEKAISDIVCQTPSGIVFISDRGLCIVSGQEVQLLSDSIREEPEYLNISELDQFEELSTYLPVSFKEYLESLDGIGYDSHNNELFFCSKSLAWNYVLNFDSLQFYQSTDKIDFFVRNTFPNLYAVYERKLKDFSNSETEETQVAIATRSIQLGTTDIKKLERVLLRATMYNVNNNSQSDKAKIAVFHSDDGVNYQPARGFVLNENGNYKDYDMGLMAREKYRNYLFVLIGTINEQSEIQYLELETDKEYNNEKMR
jgi:hypothetical protein